VVPPCGRTSRPTARPANSPAVSAILIDRLVQSAEPGPFGGLQRPTAPHSLTKIVDLAASRASVLASRPVARAKARIWRGLTTASGTPAPASAAATATSKPPVASSTTRVGVRPARRATRSSRPASSRETAKVSPVGRRCTSRRSLATSMPTKTGSRAEGGCPMTRPCECGLALRPERLFGFLDGTADGAPCSETGSSTPGGRGLPSAVSLAGSAPVGN
jgi:hypothetical protein